MIDLHCGGRQGDGNLVVEGVGTGFTGDGRRDRGNRQERRRKHPTLASPFSLDWKQTNRGSRKNFTPILEELRHMGFS